MKYLKSFQSLLNEELTIGSEAIRLKWYSDIPKKDFYALVNIDPTSVRKKDFSKPGKYTKWLIREWKKLKTFGLKNTYDFSHHIIDSKEEINQLLFIFSTGWFKKEAKKHNYSLDILTYDFDSFRRIVQSIKDKYLSETESAKYDVVYSDNKIDILVPLNFSASYETAKNTDWCTKTQSGWQSWSKVAILFRIIPRDKNLDKLKLTWNKNGHWNMACSQYPEINGDGNPFEVIDNVTTWEFRLNSIVKAYGEDWNQSKMKKNADKIKQTMGLVSKEVQDFIVGYYNKSFNI